LDVAAAALLVEAALDGGLARFRRAALARDAQSLPQGFDEPLGRELAVAPLTPLVLGNGAERGTGARHDAALLRCGQRGGGLDVEDRLDARIALLRVLATWAARAREAEVDLGARNGDRTRDADRVAV